MSHAPIPHPSMPCIECEHLAAYHRTAAPVGQRRCVRPGCRCADWVEWVGVPWEVAR